MKIGPNLGNGIVEKSKTRVSCIYCGVCIPKAPKCIEQHTNGIKHQENMELMLENGIKCLDGVLQCKICKRALAEDESVTKHIEGEDHANWMVAAENLTDASAIQCFYCNSANNSACLDIGMFANDLHPLSTIVPVVNCETAVPSSVAVNFFCRKIVQTIFHPNRESEVRVTRGCGWVPHHKECYRADNSDHLETVCQCFSDRCNGSQRVNFSFMVVLGSFVAFLLTR